MRIFVGIVGEADAIQRRMSLDLGFAASKRSQPEGGIVEDREMGKEREVLEHQPDAPLLRRNEALRPPPHLLLVEKNAACAWPLDAGRDAEQCGLAAARRPEQAEDFAWRDVEAYMVERERRATAARQVVEGEPRGEADRGLAASRASAPRFAVGQGAAARFQGFEHRADLGGETCSAQPRAVNRGRTGPTKAKMA